MYRETLPELIVAAVAVPAVPAVYPELLKLDATLLLEKPFGLDFSESQILQKIAHSVGARAFIAMNRRQYGNLRFAREALDLDSGTRLVQILDQESFEHPIQACWPSSVVKRWMYGNAIHLVDLARFFCRGEVSSVVSSGWRGFQTSPMLLTARIEFDSGDLAAYEALWSVDGPWSVAIATESQRWEMRPLEACRWRSSMSSPWTEVPPTKADLDFKPGLYLQATEAIRAARGRPHTLQSIDSALKSIELLSRIYTES
jgi:predicted dehydrogenase